MIDLSREELTGFQLGQMYPPEEMRRAVEQEQKLAKLPLGDFTTIHFVGDTKDGRKLNLKASAIKRLDYPAKGFVGLVRPVDLQEDIETEYPMVYK